MTNIALSERAKWIGASESAALLGVSPYLTRFELWHEKAGNIPPRDLSADERVMAGQFMEPSIAAWAAQKWNWPILKVTEYRRSPKVAGMGCSLDFQTVDGVEPVEIKNVDRAEFYSGGKDWAVDGDNLLDAPAHFLVQVQHQLACPDRERPPAAQGHLIVCVGGNRLFRMAIARHERMIAKIEAEVYAFWASIANNEPPRPDFEMDAETIGALYGGAGADFADLRHNERARDLCVQYRQGVEVEKAGAALKAQSLAELKMMMQDARGAIVDDGYTVKASHIKETTIARSAHWRFSVTQQKSAQGAQEKEPT